MLLVAAVIAVGLITWLSIEWGESSRATRGTELAGGVNTSPQSRASLPVARTPSSRVNRATPAVEQPKETTPRWIPNEEPARSTSTPSTAATPPAEDITVRTEELPAAALTLGTVETGGSHDVQPTGSVSGGPLGLAEGLIGEGRLVEARALLSQALDSGALTASQAADSRQLLGLVNDELVFGPSVYPGDPWAGEYLVKPGDSLSRIVSSENLKVDWRLLQLINGLNRPEHIRAGQTIKVIRGPFHALINKGNHRLDLYMGEGPERAFVRTYDVGLGAMNSTPLGRFQVRKGSKIVNPTWTNPRTGEFYPADDPENPIGEYWMGLRGIDDTNVGERSFGIHGTIDPGSIGINSSMGCVRLRDGEIDMIYAVMAEGVSTIDVHR